MTGQDVINMTEQDVIDIGIKHGDTFTCPTCGAPGRIDLNPFNAIPEFELSVWWNSHEKHWECSECWLK